MHHAEQHRLLFAALTHPLFTSNSGLGCSNNTLASRFIIFADTTSTSDEPEECERGVLGHSGVAWISYVSKERCGVMVLPPRRARCVVTFGFFPFHFPAEPSQHTNTGRGSSTFGVTGFLFHGARAYFPLPAVGLPAEESRLVFVMKYLAIALHLAWCLHSYLHERRCFRC